MKQREYEERIRELVFIFFAAPAVILIGMFAVGAILDSFIGSQNTFSLIFIAIGGIPGIISYYAREWKRFTSSLNRRK